MTRLISALGVLLCLLAAGCGSASGCAEGFEQEGTRCVPEPLDCAALCDAHETCHRGSDGVVCECAVGYQGSPCVWAGAPEDPEFADLAAWADTSNGAQVVPLADGLRGPGIASFESSVACNGGAVSQIIDMPSYASADPFVIELTYRATVEAIDVLYGHTFETLPGSADEWVTRRFCLGEAAYGGPVKFLVAASERRADCFSTPSGTIKLDRFEILVANPGECPEPGSALNGKANAANGGWFFSVQTLAGQGAATGALQSGVGKNGSDAARIYKAAGGTNRAAMGTQVSVPLPSSVPSPALRFWWRATEGAMFRSELGTFVGVTAFLTGLDYFAGTGEPETYTYCLAPWTHGGVVDLSFTPVKVGDFVNSASELVVDDVEIISDPRCGDALDVLDPGFDSSPNRWPGVVVLDPPASGVRILKDSERADPPADGFLELSYASNRSYVAMGTRIWIPRAEGNRGPQLVFYSNVEADPGVPVKWLLGRSGTINAELLQGGGWRPNEVCLPPEWAERWFRFGVVAGQSSEPLQTFDPPKHVLLDNFQLTTSERCPVQTAQ